MVKVNLKTLEKKLPLENFIPAAFFIFMLCILIISIITYQSIGNYRKDMSAIEKGYSIISESERLQVEVNYWLYLRRGLFLSNEKKTGNEIDKQKALVDSTLGRLQIISEDNPAYKSAIDSIHTNIVSLNGIVELTKMNLLNTEKMKGLEEEQTPLIRSKILKIKQLCDRIISSERELLDSNRTYAVSSSQKIQLIIIVLSIFSFMVIGFSLLISGKLIRHKSEVQKMLVKSYHELEGALANLVNEAKEKEDAQNKIKLFVHAIRSIKECVYITDLNGKVLFVNEAFEKIFGYAAGEISGKDNPIFDEGKIIPGLKTDILNKTMEGGWKGELAAQNADGVTVHTFLSTSTIRDEEGKIQAMVGICQDMSEQKRAKELVTKRNFLLNLLNEIIHYTNQSFDIHKSIRYSIDKICKYTQWDLGHCFLRKEGMLYSSGIWNEGVSDANKTFVELTCRITFRESEGIPGKIMTTGKANWLTIGEIQNMKDCKRSRQMEESGLKTGVWIPIIKENEVAGVLEFFKISEEVRDNGILECISNIGIELGSLMEKTDIIDKLRENEKNLREAQHIGKLGSWEFDVKKNLVTWSDELHAIYEIGRNDFKPSFDGFLERVHPEDRARVKKIVENAMIEKNQFDYFHRIITPSGEVKNLKAQGKVYLDEDGDVVRMFGTGQDISDIRKAEENLRRSEAKLREAQRVAKLGNWDWDVQNNTVEWSDEIYSIYGIERNGSALSHENLLEIVHPEDRNYVDMCMRKMFTDKKPSDMMFRILTKDGELKHIRRICHVVLDKSGNIERVSGVSIDITDIKSVEEELRSTNKKLIQTQKELINNEKLAALGRFSSGIAHEIRNPLANISSLTQLILNTELDEKNRKRLKHILTNSDIANQIIKNLLSFVSPEDLILKKSGIRNILENIIDSIEARCKQKNIKIVKGIQNNLPDTYIDKLRLENALMNFVSNALDAMTNGGILTINSFVNKDNRLEIEIIDTGVGIPQENFDKILEPFFTTKAEGVGLGMGLAHNTIRAHSGNFDMDSTVGEGTKIKITLPIIEKLNNGKNISH